MKCLNIKDKEVAALLDEYTNILGNYDAAYYVLSENNGYGLDKAPNGEPSKLYNDLLANYNNDHSMAIRAKAMVYSDSFKNWFGDWTKKHETSTSKIIDFNDAVDFLFEVNPELSKVGTKSEYEQYIKTIFPNSISNSIYWHGTDSDFSDGLNTAKRGKGSGAPETQNEMYFNRQPWASLQYISGINRRIKDNEGFNNWVKLWWELKEALGNGRMDTDNWKNEIIGPNIRQSSPNKHGVFDRDKGGTHGKYLSERKARYGYENKSDKEFFEEVFDIRYGKETFNDWINRKRDEFKNLWNNRSVKNGIIPAVLNIHNPITEEGQNTYYEEQRNLFTQAKQKGNDAILSNKSKNEFGSDVAIIFNPNENVHFLGTKSDIKDFKAWKNNNQVSKVVDENGEPFIVYTGTLKDFDTFDSKYSRTASKGFFFTVDKEVAKSYGNVKEVFLNIKNLKEENKELSSLDLENGKYDGVSYFHDGAEAFVVWNPNQIKSINNQGTFSTVDDNIYRSVSSTNKSISKGRIFNSNDVNDVTTYNQLISAFYGDLTYYDSRINSQGTTEWLKKLKKFKSKNYNGTFLFKNKKDFDYAREILIKKLGSDKFFDDYNGEIVREANNLYKIYLYKPMLDSVNSSINDDYLNYLDSKEYRDSIIPPFEDYDTIFNSPVSDVTEEATGSDKTLVSRLFDNKSKTTAREILARIKNKSNLASMVEILEKLGDTFLDTPIYYQSVGAAETGAAAVFSHLYKGIVVYGDANFRGKDGSADITILHELIHAATIQKIKDNSDVAESAGRLLELVRRKLEEKYGVSWEELKRSNEDKYYGLTNVYEFFAELYSNSRFIEELATLEAEGNTKPVNILKGIVNWLLNLFTKFSNVKLNKTLYEQAAGELENIMFNTNEYLDNYNNQYSNYSSDELISASITATNDANKIKKILRDNASNISFDSDSHTYTNINTGELYTPVSTVKDLNGYGADIESMSEETLEYGKFAAEVGTAIHAEIHKLLTGEDIPESNVKLSKKAKKMIKDLVLPKIMKKGDTLVASESIIANDSAKVAGTVDMIKTDEDGNVHLLDFKTKARTAFGKKKYGFDYYFSAKKETKKGGKPDSERHDYQLTMYKRMLELAGVRVDSKEVVPIEYTVDENGVITEVWVPELDYAENGLIHHRVNNALENEINKSVFSGESSNNEINNENLVKQSEIVQNILKTLKNQLAIYRVKGYTTKSEILSSFINKLNSKEEDEVIVSYINQAVTLLKPLVDTYNNALADERNGKDNVWNLKMLESWKNYAESFYNLDDIQNYLFINPNALSNLDKESYRKVREALATAISYKNVLENSYKAKGEKLWLDWLTPFSSRIEAEYRRTAEREYKKNNKGTDKINDKNAMNRYIDAYIADHRNEINLKSREMLRQQSRIATSSPLSAIGRWLDNIFESSDPIVGSMARAYHTTWMQSNEEFNNKYRELVDLTSELEKAFPQFKDDPKKLYDFMIEFNNDSYNLISSLPVSFLNAYNNAKNEIKNNPEYETARDRSIAIAAWLEQNAPIKNKKELNAKKKDIISELLDTGIISKEEYDTLIRNENRDQSLKKSWSRLVETGKLSEAAADILRERFSKLNWEYRVPNSAKYPNTKWNELQKIRKNNPNDIRVRFYDFISELAKYGDSYVPDRFKLNGRLPGMSKTARERLKSDNVASQLISDVKNDLYLRADDTDKGMQMTDELDRPIKFVPIYFTNKLSIDEQSLDIATIYKEWFKSVNNYKYINSILPQLEYTKWVVNSRKTVKTDNAGNPVKNVLSKIMNNGDSDIDPTTNALITDENLISQLNAWFDQVVYGETSQNLGTFLGMDVAKLINVFQKYTSLKIMGLNFVSMVNNALVAELQQAEEAMAGQYISAESYARATSHYISDLPNILADVGARKKTSLTNLLNERFGVFTDFSEGSMLENTRFKKLCNTSTLYFTTNLGEHEAQSRFLKGCLIEKRALDKNGNDIGSMFDFFSAENGKLVFDKEHRVANFSNSEQIAFGQKVTAILRKQHGNYATYSRPELEQTGYGKLLLNFRKWIYPTFKRRFSKEYYDEYGQTFSKGFYIDGSQFYYNKVMSFFERMSDEAKALEYAEKADWDTMTDDEKANVKRFTTEISVLFASLAMQTLISAALEGYDDKDDFGYMVLSHLDYQIYRLSTDISFYSNPASFLKIVQSPIPSSSVIKSWSNFLDSMLHPTEKFEKGDWKGEYKIKKRVMDLLPVVRQIYRLRNIDDEKQLLSII